MKKIIVIVVFLFTGNGNTWSMSTHELMTRSCSNSAEYASKYAKFFSEQFQSIRTETTPGSSERKRRLTELEAVSEKIQDDEYKKLKISEKTLLANGSNYLTIKIMDKIHMTVIVDAVLVGAKYSDYSEIRFQRELEERCVEQFKKYAID